MDVGGWQKYRRVIGRREEKKMEALLACILDGFQHVLRGIRVFEGLCDCCVLVPMGGVGLCGIASRQYRPGCTHACGGRCESQT